MSVYRETGLYRLSGEPTAHYFWSAIGRQPYPYYHAINAVHNGRAGIFVLGSETAGIGGYQSSRVFWSPVLNTGMAGIGRHGYPATNCFTAWVSAWSAGNYHLVPYVGLHGPATIWLPEQQNSNVGQAPNPSFAPNPSPFAFDPGPNPLLFLPSKFRRHRQYSIADTLRQSAPPDGKRFRAPEMSPQPRVHRSPVN